MTSHVLPTDLALRQVRLNDHDLRDSLVRFVRRRMPSGDAEDVVQDTLTDALVARWAPEDPSELRRWVFGIARRKVADQIGAAPRRHMPTRADDASHVPSDLDAVDLVRWARSEVGNDPEDARTLGWMVREGLFGDRLSSIAQESGLPAATVRQRVSRLRRMLRQRWASQLGVAAAVVLLVLGWWSVAGSSGTEVPGPDDEVMLVGPTARAETLRDRAERACEARRWGDCRSLLDDARAIDSEGERRERVVRLRRSIEESKRQPVPVHSSVAPDAEKAPVERVPEQRRTEPKSGEAVEEPCICPDYDPMCGCLPGMGRSVVPADP